MSEELIGVSVTEWADAVRRVHETPDLRRRLNHALRRQVHYGGDCQRCNVACDTESVCPCCITINVPRTLDLLEQVVAWAIMNSLQDMP